MSPRRRGKRFSILVVAAVAMAGAGLSAAEKAKGSWADVQQLRPGQSVDVALAGARFHEGKLRAASDESISLLVGGAEQKFARGEVWRVTTHNRSRNGTIGFLLGAAAGTVVGIGVAMRNDSPNPALVIGGSLAAFCGGGTAAGVLIKHHHAVYQAAPAPVAGRVTAGIVAWLR